MVRLDDILDRIECICPCGIQEDFDNCGLQLGDRKQQVSKILVALDFNDTVLNEAITQRCELIITHHPFIFSGLKCIDRDQFQGRMIYEMINHNISLISLHTNFDKVSYGVSCTLGEMLGLIDMKPLEPHNSNSNIGLGVYGDLVHPITIGDLGDILKEKLHLHTLKLVGDEGILVKRIALIGGSGASFIDAAQFVGADVFISGDFKYHDGQKAYEIGLPIIDATHFATEAATLNSLMDKLNSELGNDVEIQLSKVQKDYFDII